MFNSLLAKKHASFCDIINVPFQSLAHPISIFTFFLPYSFAPTLHQLHLPCPTSSFYQCHFIYRRPHSWSPWCPFQRSYRHHCTVLPGYRCRYQRCLDGLLDPQPYGWYGPFGQAKDHDTAYRRSSEYLLFPSVSICVITRTCSRYWLRGHISPTSAASGTLNHSKNGFGQTFGFISEEEYVSWFLRGSNTEKVCK